MVIFGRVEVVLTLSNNLAFFKERKGDTGLTTHLTFTMHYNLSTIQGSRIT